MIVAVGAVKGAGGVTATSLVLSSVLAAAGDTTLVEADPSGGSLLGWCERLSGGSGLYDAAFSRSERGLVAAAQTLGDVKAVPAKGVPFRIIQALERPRVSWTTLLRAVEGTLFVDVGRLYPGSPCGGILAAADVVLLVTPAEPSPVAATMEWISRGGQLGSADLGVSRERLRLVTTEIVGKRRHVTVSPRDLAADVGLAYIGHLPHDPSGLELLCRGASINHKSLRRSPLIDAARVVAPAVLDPSRAGVLR